MSEGWQCDGYGHVWAPRVQTRTLCKCGAQPFGVEPTNGKVVNLSAVRNRESPHYVIETGGTEYDDGPKTVHIMPESALLDYARGAAEIDPRILRRIVIEWADLVMRTGCAKAP